MVKMTLKGLADENKSFTKLKVSVDLVPISCDRKVEIDENKFTTSNKLCYFHNSKDEEASKDKLRWQHLILDLQQRDIQDLKHILQTTRSGMKFMQIKYYEEFKYHGKHMNGLAHAATNYNKVLEENRKLYNQVQDLKVKSRSA